MIILNHDIEVLMTEHIEKRIELLTRVGGWVLGLMVTILLAFAVNSLQKMQGDIGRLSENVQELSSQTNLVSHTMDRMESHIGELELQQMILREKMAQLLVTKEKKK